MPRIDIAVGIGNGIEKVELITICKVPTILAPHTDFWHAVNGGDSGVVVYSDGEKNKLKKRVRVNCVVFCW